MLNEFEDLLSRSKLSEKFYYNGKLVKQDKFIEEMNFKQFIPFTYIEFIEDAIEDFKNISANPTFYSNEHSIQLKSDNSFKGYNYVFYNNGLYEPSNLNSTKNLLMIDGNIIPNASIIVKDNKTFLPLRLICNYLNKDISYNNENFVITIDKISIDLNKGKILSNNEDITSMKLNGYTYLSLDFFEKYLNLSFSNMNIHDYINILSLESYSNDLKAISSEQAEELIKNNIEINNTKEFNIKNITRKEDLGIYYVFDIVYNFMDFDKVNTILYDRYSKKIFSLSNGIIEIKNIKLI